MRGHLLTARRRTVVIVLGLALLLGVIGSVPARATDEPLPNLETFELPTPLVDASTPGGRLEARRAAPRIHVLLPDGYAEHPDERYPVLWLLHGANGGTDTWIPGITKLLPDFPGIIVMPDGGIFGMYTDWFNGGVRGAPAWATFHLEVLRRTIEDRYRIRPERRWHAIGGISMGGQGALRYASLLPGYFGSVAAFSPALLDMQAIEAEGGLNLIGAASGASGAGVTHAAIFGPRQGAYAEGNSPRALVANLEHTRMYVTSGWGIGCVEDPFNPTTLALDTVTETVLHSQQAGYSVAARKAGVDVTAVTTCGIHTFGVWDRAIPAAERWGFFEEVPEHPARWTYRTVATTGEMWDLRFRFDAPPSAVAQFTRTGSTLTATGTGTVTISGPDGCDLRASLPFQQRLPDACLVQV